MTNDAIIIQGLAVDCIIGFYPEELETPQRVFCDLTLNLDISIAGRKGRITDTCDYVTVADEVTALLQFRKYKLLENAAEEAAAMLIANHANLLSLTFRLHKPGALRERAKSVAIEITRTRTDFPAKKQTRGSGVVETFLQTKNAVFSIAHLPAGASFSFPESKLKHRLIWLVSGKAIREGNAVAEFQPVQSDGELPAVWENTGAETASIFCCEMKSHG